MNYSAINMMASEPLWDRIYTPKNTVLEINAVALRTAEDTTDINPILTLTQVYILGI